MEARPLRTHRISTLSQAVLVGRRFKLRQPDHGGLLCQKSKISRDINSVDFCAVGIVSKCRSIIHLAAEDDHIGRALCLVEKAVREPIMREWLTLSVRKQAFHTIALAVLVSLYLYRGQGLEEFVNRHDGCDGRLEEELQYRLRGGFCCLGRTLRASRRPMVDGDYFIM
jgi:hypothetical protein